MEDSEDKKRGRDESEEAELERFSPEVKRLRENLLDNSDDDTEFLAATQELDSFVKEFEEEITASPSAGAGSMEFQLVDLTADSGDPWLDLGYLFEASDEALGLPLTASSSIEATTLVQVESDMPEFGSELFEALGYDSFELGLWGSVTNYSGGNGEYAALGGLFD